MDSVNSLRDLKTLVSATAATDALRELTRGNLAAAYRSARKVAPGKLALRERERLGSVFYEHGKLLAAKGRLDDAAADFGRALKLGTSDELVRLRLQMTNRALQKERSLVVADGSSITEPDRIRRLDVATFCREMKGRRNLALSGLPPAAVLHYVRKAGYLHPPRVGLPERSRLDDFQALGTYRWRGDEKALDQFSIWVRALKTGDATVGRHLGRLFAEWLVSETDCAGDADYLIAVPGGPDREVERDASPSQVLARGVQEHIGVPWLSGVLQRSESTRARHLPYAEVARYFTATRSGGDIASRNVLLIDDVATRGYTLRACSDELHRLGAKRVACVTLAQSVTSLRETRGQKR